jgi:hydroxymethylbilane synthase
VLAERSLLSSLRGGCLAPVGAWGRVQENGALKLTATVLSRDGSKRIAAEAADQPAAACELGHRVAQQLLAQGAAALIETSRTV